MSPRITALVLIVFLTAFTSLRVLRYTQKSATWDEPIHLTAGYVALVDRDFRVEPSHPPFMREWAAIPAAFIARQRPDTTEIDRSQVTPWLTATYDFARRFLYVQNDADRLLYPARFMVLLWGCVLGVLLFAWTYEWRGPLAAVLVLGFYTLEPNLVSHSALVTTDFGVTCFIFAAVYFLWRASRTFTAWNVVGVAAAVALAAITKFSSVLLAPILLLLMAVAIGRRTEMTWRRAGVLLGVIAAATVFAIWAVYGFRYRPSASPTWLFTLAALPNLASVPVLATVVGWIDAHHLLPNAYSVGFLFSQASVRQLPAFMAGTIRPGGWWYYFPFAFALKTPVSLLVLFAIGFVLLVRGKRRPRSMPTGAFILLPIAVYVAVAMASGINIGVRHILPVYPFVLMAAAAAAETMWTHREKAVRVGLAVLLVAWVGEFARAYPHTLTFFNTFAGGPKNGYRYLADSNLGWGGNLKLLKRWMDRRGVREINLAYFGSADPAYYKINATYLPGSATYLDDQIMRPKLPGYVAISATVLDGVYLPPWWRIFYGGFYDREPVAVVGNSLRVYWVDSWPEPPLGLRTDPEALTVLGDGLMEGLDWPERAIRFYSDAIRNAPNNGPAWNGLGVALSRVGRLDEAAASFERASALLPGDPNPRQNLFAVRRQLAR